MHFPKQEVSYLDANGQRQTLQTRFDDRYFMGLCSEKRISVKKNKAGKHQVGFEMQWVKLTSSTRNEQLDTMVYAFGVFEVCRQDEWIARKWKEVQAKLKEQPAPVENREMMLNPPTEAKIPELKVEPERKILPQRRKIRINSPFRRFGI
jgi:phage terminase large subunit GpA-like protein